MSDISEEADLVKISKMFLINIKIARNISVSYSNDLSIKDNLSQKFIQKAKSLFDKLKDGVEVSIEVDNKYYLFVCAEMLSESVGYIKDIKNFKTLKEKDDLVDSIFVYLEKISSIM